MVKRLKLPSIFKRRKTKPSWKWSPFKNLKYISFGGSKETKFKSPNNTALSSDVKVAAVPDSQHAWSPYSKCFSAELEESGGELMVEMAVKALTSKRLSFEPAGDTSLMTGAIISRFHFQDCVVHAIESTNPYADFKNSMKEMLEDYGKKDWDYAEELLAWYLRMNRKNNHGFIVEAFVDMFAGFAASRSIASYHASSSSSKSKDWWEIEVESFLSRAKNGNIHNLTE